MDEDNDDAAPGTYEETGLIGGREKRAIEIREYDPRWPAVNGAT